MEKGLTFIEFNYMLLQAYDFYRLYEDHDCKLQLGGNDQWSNIIAGVDLIRRKTGNDDAQGLTTNLLLNSEGVKMGKTANGAVWLDEKKMPVYDFYQYWRNVDDADVIKCLKLLTFLDLEEIAQYEKLEGADINEAKKRLAFEVTKLIHGEEKAKAAEAQAYSIFVEGQSSDDMETTELAEADLNEGIGLLNLLVETGLASSNGEGRRLVQQGGISLNGKTVDDTRYTVTADDLVDDEIIIRRGKKRHHRVVVAE